MQMRLITQPGTPGSLEAHHATTHDWDIAVNTASAHLNEGWILPETKCHPAVAEELAALYSAYGVFI
jgi:hypothetical protein